MRLLFIVVECFSICVATGCGHGSNSGPQSPQLAKVTSTTPDNGVERLIDQLVAVAEPGFGYSVYFSGTEFLPYDETGEISSAVLGATQRARSEAMREIVRQGAASVSTLLKHINDSRATKIPPVSGMMWIEFSDEYDFNQLTRQTAPAGVNRREFGSGKKHPNEHAITVGDLCFVALGQIVNRHFAATRYQPTGGLIVSSPTYSAALRNVILEDWSTLSSNSLKKLLIEDFLKPDHEYRRTGAYLRLALYYPDAVEDLIVDVLSKPTFDIFAIEKFCRENLYRIDGHAERKMAYDEFVRDHGAAAAEGIRRQLFDDLDSTDRFGSRPKDLLIQLHGLPAGVTASSRPASEFPSQTEQARFIGTLIHDDSRKAGDIVLGLFLKNQDNAYFAGACLRCLANRGYDDFLLEQLGKIDATDVQARNLYANYIEAIAISRAPAVRAKLFDILKRSANESYFMAALPAVDRGQDGIVGEAARRLLAGLPADTKSGEQLLQMIGQRFPSEAKWVYQSFLSIGSANRAETMCRVLWYGNPLSKELLAPLLDDRRELAGFSRPMRVCDRAAQAISHTSKEIRFESEGSLKNRDAQIEKLKQFCTSGAP